VDIPRVSIAVPPRAGTDAGRITGARALVDEAAHAELFALLTERVLDLLRAR
jgi:hypothetical protein